MELKPHVSLAGSSTNSPFRVFSSTRGPKIAQAWQKSIGVKTLTIEVVYQIWGLYMIFKAMNADKWLWPIFGGKVGQSVQIGMKLEFDVWHHPLDVYAKFQTDISQHVQKSPENFSLAGSSSNTPPFKCFCPPEGQKLPNHDENQYGSRHSQYECVYQIWGLYIIVKAMNADKCLWPIFGCKVGQSVPIGMKLELEV